MELPRACVRVRNALELFAVPDEAISFVTARTGLARLGEGNPDLAQLLPRTTAWNARGSTQDDTARAFDALAQLESAPSDARFVLKVDGTSRARGVRVLRGGERLSGLEKARVSRQRCVLQDYVPRPCLISSAPGAPEYKWDMRVYVLVVLETNDKLQQRVAGFQYRHGFARRCAEPYDAASKSRMAHLTNTAVNNKAGDHELATLALAALAAPDELGPAPLADAEDYEALLARPSLQQEQGMPLTMRLDDAWRRLREGGAYSDAQVAAAEEGVRAAVATLLARACEPCIAAARPAVQTAYRKHVSLFGLDVLLDADLRPFILEVNRSPDMSCYSLDQLDVKQQLLQDALACAFPGAEWAGVARPGADAALRALSPPVGAANPGAEDGSAWAPAGEGEGGINWIKVL